MLLFSAYSQDDVPLPSYHHQDQIWGFFSQESPLLIGSSRNAYAKWNNNVNWTLTYRLDSDFVIPCGEFRAAEKNLSERMPDIEEDDPLKRV
jgi:hypothetical protein